jgi:hypothetical protein
MEMASTKGEQRGQVLSERNCQARGAFLVSAAKSEQDVYFLEVRARRDGVCRLMNPWPGREIEAREAGSPAAVTVQFDSSIGARLTFEAAAGRTYRFQPR